MAETELEKRDYEIAYLVRDEAHVPAVFKLLKTHSAEIRFEGPLKRLALAYKIGKESQAYFGYVHVRLLPASLAALERDLRVDPHLLRYLVVGSPLTREKRTLRGERREVVPAAPVAARLSTLPLSNEELERKIDEILQ